MIGRPPGPPRICTHCDRPATRYYDRHGTFKSWDLTCSVHKHNGYDHIKGEANPKWRGGRADKHIRLDYGITRAEWNELLAEQEGLCAVCRVRPATDVDHDHENGTIRGLLCGSCNRGIGLLRDDPMLLEKAAAYLFVAADRGGKLPKRVKRGR